MEKELTIKIDAGPCKKEYRRRFLPPQHASLHCCLLLATNRITVHIM